MTDTDQPYTPSLTDALAQEIRRVDGAHKLGAGGLAEALMPFIEAVRAEERAKAAQIAREGYRANERCDDIAARIRAAGKEQS